MLDFVAWRSFKIIHAKMYIAKMEVSVKPSDLQIQKVTIQNVFALPIKPALSVKGPISALIFVKMEAHASAIMKARSVAFVLLALEALGATSVRIMNTKTMLRRPIL